MVLKILQGILESDPQLTVVGTAKNGREALSLIPKLDPAVICTDYHMPVMDGLKLIREVMQEYPRPILVLSVSTQKNDAQKIFDMVEAGALDVMGKPRGGRNSNYQEISKELIKKIKVISGVYAFKKKFRPALPSMEDASFKNVDSADIIQPRRVNIVCIGSSTGGPNQLKFIFSQLPKEFPVPILCVQHVGEEFLEGLADWLGNQCRIKICFPNSGESPQPGHIYFPRRNTHLEIDDNGRIYLRPKSISDPYCPSIDITFRSVVNYYGKTAAAILLTGIGKDGADGMLAISKAGGLTIAQNEESCIVFGMPREAIIRGAAEKVLSPEAILHTLLGMKKIETVN